MMCNLTRSLVTAAGILYATQAGALDTTPEMREVPVPADVVRDGDIITDAHITWREMDLRRLPDNIVLDKNTLIGLEATRTLRADWPIAERYVRVPPMARRGSDVKVVFNAPGVEMFTEGRAMEDGEKGDTIRLTTNISSRVLTGRVVATDTILVD